METILADFANCKALTAATRRFYTWERSHVVWIRPSADFSAPNDREQTQEGRNGGRERCPEPGWGQPVMAVWIGY